jgi:phosphatidate cytidylyltransferase
MVSGVLAIAGQVGDLAESRIKRNYGVKDSGKILPGHGGFLDRVDALLFAIPVFYVFVIW